MTMGERPRTYRLPFGGMTTDVDIYTGEWDALVAKAKRFFPGYEWSSRDPHIIMEKLGVNGLGKVVVMDCITLTPEAIRVLSAPTEDECGPLDSFF